MLKVKAEGGGHKLYATVRHVQELVLFCAIENDIETLRSMLAIPGARDVIGVNVKVDRNGMRALHHAAFHGNKPLLELLLELGADPFALDKASHSALYYAMATFKWDCATLLASKMSEIMPHPTLDRHNICPPQPSLPPTTSTTPTSPSYTQQTQNCCRGRHGHSHGCPTRTNRNQQPDQENV